MHDLPDEASRVAADSLLARLGIVVANVEIPMTLTPVSRFPAKFWVNLFSDQYPYSNLSPEQIRQLQARFGKRK